MVKGSFKVTEPLKVIQRRGGLSRRPNVILIPKISLQVSENNTEFSPRSFHVHTKDTPMSP